MLENSHEADEHLKKEIEDQAIIYRKSPLTDFQIRVNDAAIDLALLQPSLLRKGNRGILLRKHGGKLLRKAIASKKVRLDQKFMEMWLKTLLSA